MAGWSHRTGRQSLPLPLRATMVRERPASVGTGEAAATMSYLGHWKTKPQQCKDGGAVFLPEAAMKGSGVQDLAQLLSWANFLLSKARGLVLRL